MGFSQGLSGLNAAARQLDIIGNNIANAETAGFKKSRTEFGDMYASMNSASNMNEVGMGVSSSVRQMHLQGNIASSENPLDMAIDGNGFFRMDRGGVITYSRAGQFGLDKNGYIVTEDGRQLTGYGANVAGQIMPTTVGPIQITTQNLQPFATQNVNVSLNLDSRKAVNGNVFDPLNPSTYEHSTSQTYIDSLGNSHTGTWYFQKAAAGSWDTYLTVDGAQVNLGNANGSTTLTFNASGQVTSPLAPITLPAIPIPPASNLQIDADFTKMTQYASNFAMMSVKADGYASGYLTGIMVGNDGTLTGQYSNGQTLDVGQVVIANFANPEGLASIGDNQWIMSPSSGQPQLGTPQSGSMGTLNGSSYEESNVNLTEELVAMINAQRYYQANAQTIKTHDQILQTIVNLK